jgi:biotin transporter BioY
MGPTGGYLAGFVLAAFVTGFLAERGWDRRVGTTLLAMLLGNVVIYVPGLAWLAAFVGADRTLAMGLYPFIIGDLLKIACATALLPLGWKLTKKNDRTILPPYASGHQGRADTRRDS